MKKQQHTTSQSYSNIYTTCICGTSKWTLGDPDFATPGKIDLLLGADNNICWIGQRCGPQNTPTAFETQFGWVIAGRTSAHLTNRFPVASNHCIHNYDDDFWRRFWEIEASSKNTANLSPEEPYVVKDFHSQSKSGRYIVSLPKKTLCPLLGESRPQAVRRFLALERLLYSKCQFREFANVMNEYFTMNHVDPVSVTDLKKSPNEVFYLSMHPVRKEHSSTTKIRTVFDASVKSSSDISLNDTLLIGPMVHSSLIDLLL